MQSSEQHHACNTHICKHAVECRMRAIHQHGRVGVVNFTCRCSKTNTFVQSATTAMWVVFGVLQRICWEDLPTCTLCVGRVGVPLPNCVGLVGRMVSISRIASPKLGGPPNLCGPTLKSGNVTRFLHDLRKYASTCHVGWCKWLRRNLAILIRQVAKRQTGNNRAPKKQVGRAVRQYESKWFSCCHPS